MNGIREVVEVSVQVRMAATTVEAEVKEEVAEAHRQRIRATFVVGQIIGRATVRNQRQTTQMKRRSQNQKPQHQQQRRIRKRRKQVST